MKYKFPFRRRAITAIVASVFILGACGGQGSESADSAPTSSEQSLKIVSLSPTATEMLYAIGAGDQVAHIQQKWLPRSRRFLHTSQAQKQFLRMNLMLF
jgi:hypothetical protein